MSGETSEEYEYYEDDEPARFMARRSDQVIAGLAVSVIGLGTVFYHFVESWSWVDSFYFSSVVLSTVGFGDLTPTSDGSKLFTVFYIFGGVALISAFIDSRLKRHSRRAKKRYVQAAQALDKEVGSDAEPGDETAGRAGPRPKP